MQKALFIKATENMGFKDIISQTEVLTKSNSKMIDYIPFIELALSDTIFSLYSTPVIQTNDIYNKYGPQSISDKMGYWHCIVLKNIKTFEKLAIYTGGRTIPLYVALF